MSTNNVITKDQALEFLKKHEGIYAARRVAYAIDRYCQDGYSCKFELQELTTTTWLTFSAFNASSITGQSAHYFWTLRIATKGYGRSSCRTLGLINAKKHSSALSTLVQIASSLRLFPSKLEEFHSRHARIETK